MCMDGLPVKPPLEVLAYTMVVALAVLLVLVIVLNMLRKKSRHVDLQYFPGLLVVALGHWIHGRVRMIVLVCLLVVYVVVVVVV